MELVNLGKVGSVGDVTKSIPAPYNDASKYFILDVYLAYDDGTRILMDDQTGWTRCFVFVNAGNASVFIRTTNAAFNDLSIVIAVMRIN